jgi:predicted ABC-type ATPase
VNQPKFRLFAGPNGSGKSTLIHAISKDFQMGYFINADQIEYELANSKYIDLFLRFGKLNLTYKDWKDFLYEYQQEDSRANIIDFTVLDIQESILVWKGSITSYAASIIASFLRYRMIQQSVTFSFETVMSHPSKVEFITRAQKLGFKTYLYFICTDDPLINIERVKNRKQMGGHNVDPKLIESRYYRSLENLQEAFLKVDRAFVIDSSNRNRNLILEKKGETVFNHTEMIPGWVNKYLLEKLNWNGFSPSS